MTLRVHPMLPQRHAQAIQTQRLPVGGKRGVRPACGIQLRHFRSLQARFAAISLRFEALGARDVAPACWCKPFPPELVGTISSTPFSGGMRRCLWGGPLARYFPLWVTEPLQVGNQRLAMGYRCSSLAGGVAVAWGGRGCPSIRSPKPQSIFEREIG